MVPTGFGVNRPAKNNLGMLNVSTVPLECVYALQKEKNNKTKKKTSLKSVVYFGSLTALVRALT